MAKDGRTYGMWVADENSDLIEEFDRLHNTGDDTYSRSEHMKEALRLANKVAKTQRDIEYELEGVPLRHWIRQCMLDKARREAREE